MPEIEILRAGSFTAMGGDAVAISAADLAAIAEGYDAALHEAPIVVGHPEANAPAYGWVRGLAVRNDRLVAEVDQLDPAFGELVQAGRFKKVSASLYRPGSAASPKPGSWYLRHVGFLGAQPPAVKGLKPIALGEDDDAVVIELAEGRVGWLASMLAQIFARLRDRLVAAEGVEPADQVLPAWQIESLQRLAAEADAATVPNASFAETEETRMPDTQAAPAADATATDLAEREAALASRDAELAERAATIASREAALRRQEIDAEIEALVDQGRVLPAEKDRVVGLMAALDADATVELGEGEARPAAAVLRELLSGLPVRVEFGERAKGGDAVPADAAGIAAAALKLQEAEPGLDIATAVRRVTKGGQA
jgi:hypothetical protein